jgi:hypothetical protein
MTEYKLSHICYTASNGRGKGRAKANQMGV